MTSSFHQSAIGNLRRLRVVWCLISMGVLGACGSTSYQSPTVHRAGPGMSGYYGTRTPGDLAYGGPTGLQPSERAQVDLDQYLKTPEARAPLAKAQPMRAHTRVRAQAPQLALLPQTTLPILENPPASTPTAPTAVPADPTAAAPQAAAPSSDAQRYASREAQSSQQQKYRGGDVVVISVSTILIVLLIVLIILLIR